MTKTPISKEYLLSIAMKIIKKDGIDALSIRRVAKEADVSVGSVYNYFESKSQITFEVMNLLWESAFIPDVQSISEMDSYINLIIQAHDRIQKHAKTYHTIFVGHFRSLSEEERLKSRKEHMAQIQKFADLFLEVLKNDTSVRQDIWTEDFTMQQFNQFVIRNLLESLRNGENDINFLKSLLELTLKAS